MPTSFGSVKPHNSMTWSRRASRSSGASVVISSALLSLAAELTPLLVNRIGQPLTRRTGRRLDVVCVVERVDDGAPRVLVLRVHVVCVLDHHTDVEEDGDNDRDPRPSTAHTHHLRFRRRVMMVRQTMSPMETVMVA